MINENMSILAASDETASGIHVVKVIKAGKVNGNLTFYGASGI